MQAKSANNLWGIDVSKWQGSIDWLAVAGAGVQFAFVKATEGVGYTDPMFRRNAGGANAAGVKVGFYHFAHPDNNPVSEAESFIEAVKGLPVDLPYVLDLEKDKGLNGMELTDWAYQWLMYVKKSLGKSVMLYTGAAFARRLGEKLGQFPLWVAHYGTNQPMNNTTWERWAVFQYSQGGSCPGIKGYVDMNLMEVDFLENPKLTKFDDVPAGHWAESVIKTVSEAGLMNGYDNLFAPDKPITRAEVAKVVNDLLWLINNK